MIASLQLGFVVSFIWCWKLYGRNWLEFEIVSRSEVWRSHTILLTAECCPTLQVFFAVKSNSSQVRVAVLFLQCARISKLFRDEVVQNFMQEVLSTLPTDRSSFFFSFFFFIFLFILAHEGLYPSSSCSLHWAWLWARGSLITPSRSLLLLSFSFSFPFSLHLHMRGSILHHHVPCIEHDTEPNTMPGTVANKSRSSWGRDCLLHTWSECKLLRTHRPRSPRRRWRMNMVSRGLLKMAHFIEHPLWCAHPFAHKLVCHTFGSICHLWLQQPHELCHVKGILHEYGGMMMLHLLRCGSCSCSTFQVNLLILDFVKCVHSFVTHEAFRKLGRCFQLEPFRIHSKPLISL